MKPGTELFDLRPPELFASLSSVQAKAIITVQIDFLAYGIRNGFQSPSVLA